MADLIYSVRNIFNAENQDGCLSQHGASKYLIPSYQRGYKWASDDTGAVTILLNDLKKAFELQKKEYYLQYITVKETKVNQDTVLELIDGQQRLTTLSILIAVAANNLEKQDFANDKLDYEVRGDFFQPAIHTDLRQYLGKDLNKPSSFSQDEYYIISAAQKINEFVQTYDLSDKKYSFFDFVADKVKIIVNVVDRGDSERVFSNLNSNKVSLTEAELIKGILLTKVTRGDDKRKRFREITEERMKLGMLWDEMARWCNYPEVRSFYFKDEKDGMTELMKFALYYKYPGTSYNEKKDPKDYPLFNCYLYLPNHQEAYQAIVDSYRVLRDLYEDTEVYNLLGYLMSVKEAPFKFCVEMVKLKDSILGSYIQAKKTKKELKVWLLKQIKGIIPKENVGDLWYGENDVDIHRVLLALNVFEPDDNRISRSRFDFYSFKSSEWTLEHIFPQSPEGKNQNLDDQKKEEFKKMISEIKEEKLKNEVLGLLNKPSRTEGEKELLKNALDKVVNTIGNMCLLTRGDNASNGCKFFKEKRNNIYDLITKGSFVPRHTFEVFSKMILKNPGTVEVWTKSNMDEHKDIIVKRIDEIHKFEYK
ncbi:MAG: DUF262 domain-containing protein [Bacteroidales bacterium]|nr:DUF262 domain-containing protein [Bacteroidales bacterium]